jgi:choline-glycine betaine transporter
MHDIVGEIVSATLETVTDVAVNGGAPDRPSWLRWVWGTLMVVVAIAVLAVLLWPR